MNRPFGALAIAATASLSVSLAACSAKDAKQDSAKSDTTKVAQAGTPASRGSFDPTTRVAVVHAKDFSFEAPDSITAGWTTFQLVNEGPNLHHIQLVRLDSGKTVADIEAAFKKQGPPPSWLVFVGGPNAPNPGSTSDGTINLSAGSYALLCLVDIPGHVPHMAKGMLRPLTVTANAGATGTEPTADVTLNLADYSFTVTGPYANAGKHTFKVVNKGPQPHEVEIIRLAPGKTMKDLGAWMEKAFAGTPDGPPPADAIGGISSEIPGSSMYFSADLTPGNYVMLCFVPDAKDGKAHLDHGMVKEFAVK